MRWLAPILLLVLCGCTDEGEQPFIPTGWTPGTVIRSARDLGPRGLLDRRGLIHAHSVYSHDACDSMPRDASGAIDEVCFEDFRRDLCTAQHDFVMLTDHRESFTTTEFPETLLYRPERGDVLVERGGIPTASWAACADGEPALILSGGESATMPVGLEGHVSADEAERSSIYGDESPAAVAALKAAGAVVLIAHTENYAPQQLIDLGLDGFEMYNLHANLLRNLGPAAGLIGQLNGAVSELPHPDLILLPILKEDADYLATWGSIFASGERMVTTMGTDCHRNSFPQLLPDGERVDSYRRMMQWFSNHLLVRPRSDGSFDDAELKEALASGRLYGAFEFLGYPVGFDFYAIDGATREMGDEASIANGAELHVTKPTLFDLDVNEEPPVITLRILQARDGGWDVVLEGTTDLVHAVTSPGAYRAEIRMQPRHLRRYLSSYEPLATQEVPWIYSNAIYLVD